MMSLGFSLKDREFFKKWLINHPEKTCTCGSRFIVYVSTGYDCFRYMTAFCRSCDKVWNYVVTGGKSTHV